MKFVFVKLHTFSVLLILLIFLTNVVYCTPPCAADEYSHGGAVFELNCTGDTLSYPFNMEEYEALFFGTIPQSTVFVEVNVTSDVDLDIAIMREGYNPLDPRDIFPEINNNTDNSDNYTGINACYAGYQCTIDQQTNGEELDGMNFTYSGDQINQERVTIEHTTQDVDIWLVAYGTAVGEVTVTYGTVSSGCNDTTPSCTPCDEYTRCIPPELPTCDGTATVVCVDSSSPSPSPITLVTTESATTTEQSSELQCYNTDYEKTDRDGYSCALGYTDEMFCGRYDDEDFSSVWMCCKCGGGKICKDYNPAMCTSQVTMYSQCDSVSNARTDCCLCGGGNTTYITPEPEPVTTPEPCADVDNDGVCDDVDDCVGTVDICGVCNGAGAQYVCGCSDAIEEGFCDCDRNSLDSLGVCGGDCNAGDIDMDRMCDDWRDDCLPFDMSLPLNATVNINGTVKNNNGIVDGCGRCGGFGPIYNCGCSDMAPGTCDCVGNTLDAIGLCGGSCEHDLDGDGICDDVDDCVANMSNTNLDSDGYNTCGVCNGGSANKPCGNGCLDMASGTCDCDGSVLDAVNSCGGSCQEDIDSDGICDTVDSCVSDGTNAGDGFDSCGVCNGVGEVYECGCFEKPPGACDCYGNTLDALGNCNGTCLHDVDRDNVCDDNGNDPCVGFYDVCARCNGLGDVFECGCTNMSHGFCNCHNDTLDAVGDCLPEYLQCIKDEDGDGICELYHNGTVGPDECLWNVYDSCGLCESNGPYHWQCQCRNISAGYCSCGNQTLDALGECVDADSPNRCLLDSDNDGFCDIRRNGTVEDTCIGNVYDECAVCHGPGAVYACGCESIRPGMCDCLNNTLDAVGVCGGNCTADVDQDDICDDVDDCINEDICNVCGGPGAIYSCGCFECTDTTTSMPTTPMPTTTSSVTTAEATTTEALLITTAEREKEDDPNSKSSSGSSDNTPLIAGVVIGSVGFLGGAVVGYLYKIGKLGGGHSGGGRFASYNFTDDEDHYHNTMSTSTTNQTSHYNEKSSMSSMQTVPSTEIEDEHEIFTL